VSETTNKVESGEAPVAKTRSTGRGSRKPVALASGAESVAEVGAVAEVSDAPAPKKRAPARRKPVAAAEAPAGEKAGE
jgi:hypothetical protein